MFRKFINVGLRGALLALVLALPAAVQAAEPTLKSLVDGHGSVVAGDVMITNFRTPVVSGFGFADVRSYGKGDDVTLRAELSAAGKINLIFTAIDPVTGVPTPAFIDAANGAAASPNQAYYMTYDVVVTNPALKLHAVDNTWGPSTVSAGASAAVNLLYYFNAAGGNGSGTTLYLDAFVNSQYLSGRPLGGMLLPQVENWTTVGNNDYYAYRFGSVWGLVSGPWGGVRVGHAYYDNFNMSFTLVSAAAPVAAPQMTNLFGDAVYLSAPAGPGGVTVALTSSDPATLAVPAAVTVPEGARYAPIPIVETPLTSSPVYVTVTGTQGSISRTAFYEVWPAVWPPAGPPQPSLTVATSGPGKVASADKKLACGLKCTATYPVGGTASLTAQPSSNSHFVGWSGACSGTALICVLPVNDPGINVIALFEANAPAGGGGGGATQYTLSIGRSNPGTVTSDLSGINCGNTCSAKFAQGTVVVLTATPPVGKSFASWSGACIGTAPTCMVTMSGNATAQANFNK